MMQTAAVQKISEQNSHIKQCWTGYMIGYTDAMNQERSHRRAARERRERKKVFCHAEVKRRCITDFHGRSNQDFRGGCNNSVYNRSFRVIHAFIQRNVDYQ
mgnify:CR=1 FL=1